MEKPKKFVQFVGKMIMLLQMAQIRLKLFNTFCAKHLLRWHQNIDLLNYKRRVSVFSVCILGHGHKNGHCQTDFVCEHPSHNKFSKKKHKLVCEEQSQTNENKQLLEEYKSRCILKQKANLPEYSKEIKLSFHASNSIHINNKLQQTIHLTQWASDIQDKTIYILQTIDVNNLNNTISFTTVDVGIWCQGIQQSNV